MARFAGTAKTGVLAAVARHKATKFIAAGFGALLILTLIIILAGKIAVDARALL